MMGAGNRWRSLPTRRSGVVLIAFGHYIYSPERHNLVLLGLFSAYTGAALFLIFGFSNPYSPPAELHPGPLQTLARSCSLEARALLTRPLGPPR